MPEYKFVTVEGQNGKLPKPTSSIRSHAIRAGLQRPTSLRRTNATGRSACSMNRRKECVRRRFEPPQETVASQDPTRPSIVSMESMVLGHGSANTESVHWVSPEAPTRLLPYCIESISAGDIDPFHSLPVLMNQDINHLLKYFLAKFNLGLAATDRKRSWFSYALQNAPMMHSTLAMTAALWRTEFPWLRSSIQLEGIHQKGEALRMIRGRLAHVVSVGNENEIAYLLSAISTLVIVESYDSDFEAAELHLGTIHKLFSSQGGRDSFRDQFILFKAMNLADIQVAAALGCQLKFPLLHTHQTHLPTSVIEQALHPPFDHSINQDPDDLFQIFTLLRQLLVARQTPKLLPDVLNTMYNVADGSILRYLYQDRPDGVIDTTRRSQALVLAAHIFMYVTMRQVSSSPLLRHLCARLRRHIELALPSGEIWTRHRTALMWVAFVGLLGTQERASTCSEARWFLKLFQCTVQKHLQEGPLSGGSIHETLAAFLWDQPHCQPLLASL